MCRAGVIQTDRSIPVAPSQQLSCCRDWSAHESNPEPYGRESRPMTRAGDIARDKGAGREEYLL